MGQEFRNKLLNVQVPTNNKEVRGRGLLIAVDLTNKALSPVSAYDFCIKLIENHSCDAHSCYLQICSSATVQKVCFYYHNVLDLDIHIAKKRLNHRKFG